MQTTTGHVTFNEQNATGRFGRFVEEFVQDWIRERSLAEDELEYEVAFFDEDALGEISCLVVVQNGEQMWRSWETADNPRLALLRSLQSMHSDRAH